LKPTWPCQHFRCPRRCNELTTTPRDRFHVNGRGSSNERQRNERQGNDVIATSGSATSGNDINATSGSGSATNRRVRQAR